MKNVATQKLKKFVVDRLFSYDPTGLHRFLVKIGVTPGDTLMIHSSWRPLNGFQGTPAHFGQTLRNIVGEDGLVIMPSLTYHNMSSAEFLASGKPMDVRRSPSAMGLLTEVFRRGKGVARSLSPTHPLLAWGHDASAFLDGHERTDRPFGPESPFARLLERNALILCVDTGFASITFTHFVEDRLSDTLGFPLYEPNTITATVIDMERESIDCPTRVISAQANALRREQRLIRYLLSNHALQSRKLGNTRMLWIRAKDLLRYAEDLARNGDHFFDKPKNLPPK